MRLQDKCFYDPISHERISGELAICCSKNPKSLEVYHILFTAVYFNNKLNTTINTIIQKSNTIMTALTGLMINTPNGGLYSNLRFSLEF
jgi:hypothetical protein